MSASSCLAIRREDVNLWERRAPLAPSHVRQLTKEGVKVLLQPSNRRAYPTKEYENAGAISQEDISEADLILGVKQVPIDKLIPNKTYVFFSHTIKAQEDNMPLLDALLEKNIRLIDYEKMLNKDGLRLVAFGKYAGVAGMLNILHGLGFRLLALGHHTPFMHISPPHHYRNSGSARQAIRDAGYEIALGLMPKSIGPLTFVFTGSGNVSQGAQEVFRELPHEYVSPEALPKVAKHGATNKVYGCEVNMWDHLVRKEGGKFDMEEFLKHPERYGSNFAKKIAPYASIIVNGIYWDNTQPRLITIPDAKTLLKPTSLPWLPNVVGCPQLPHHLLAICDISADRDGSIEFVSECTTIDRPFVLYDADQNTERESFHGPGVLVCSIDNMPAQIPNESTDFFGSLLFPYIHDMLSSNATTPFEEYKVTPVVRDAVITSNGKLTPKFEYIAKLREVSRSAHKVSSAKKMGNKKVLCLGAGYVSAPVVDYLTRDPKVEVTVVSHLRSEVDALASKFKNSHPVLCDVMNHKEELEKLVSSHDLVISLLPYVYHPEVAKVCIMNKKNMVTASYMSKEMTDLEQSAVDAGITVVNEVGVDPGIDHMLAMECFDNVTEKGGKVASFVSWCGGLPAPELSANPLRYRFSWSPRGVLLNTISEAKYLLNGKTVEIQPGGELLQAAMPLSFLPGFNLEGFPNRDSIAYKGIYGLDSLRTILRGTVRYTGFSNAAAGLVQIGLIDTTPHPSLHPLGPEITWRHLMCELCGKPHDILLDSLHSLILQKTGGSEARLQAIQELGLLEDEVIDKKNTPLDTLSHYLAQRLKFERGERDVIIMRHDVGIEWPDLTKEVKQIDLVVYGDPEGYTAMAKTVGLPTGIAARMILDGEIQQKGMLRPLNVSMYRPMLKRLQQEGIVARETSKVVDGGSMNDLLASSFS
ncbi:alpha-aminoadipic semialdehyde synthase, mitochondrial isoform X2 [Lingula anatina]|uniref:Alpha-aminoadipic semialdehyde synthase, mitochondrial isoform X2 n=1 Tax=Lingula anatina TaxID=7574 RepID=A0A1S3JQA6_LINAN|nr:alpha-aminoadipic semialdehyde synthase, mitochondrial isoform X2 [Lingula anatina]|eukprot:XP_013412540.1 alpha-aminoadipic semialdehyde synthase, mitochondrial isoform X2 [Lingula anatina]